LAAPRRSRLVPAHAAHSMPAAATREDTRAFTGCVVVLSRSPRTGLLLRSLQAPRAIRTTKRRVFHALFPVRQCRNDAPVRHCDRTSVSRTMTSPAVAKPLFCPARRDFPAGDNTQSVAIADLPRRGLDEQLTVRLAPSDERPSDRFTCADAWGPAHANQRE